MIALFLLSAAFADEGMWMPEQLPALGPRLAEMGLDLPAEQLADTTAPPLGAIVSLGWCSAAFISPDGLIGTNHHCVQGYLQYNSSAETDLHRDGFLAASQQDELWAGPGAELYVVESITDVTDRVLRKTGRRDRDRYERVERAKKELVAECEQQPDRDCRVAAYWGGAEFRLIQRRVYKDVRLVYAPPASVGSYGGEEDNWMWPRHSGDFAFVRAYVGPEGEAAEHSADNVPYRPPYPLPLDLSGAQDGEFVMVAGYPWETYRYRSAAEMRFMRDEGYPFKLRFYGRMVDAMRQMADDDPEAAARLSAPIDWIANSLKYAQGMSDAFEDADLEADKQARRDGIDAWAATSRRHARALAELDALEAERRSWWQAEQLAWWLVHGSDLQGSAHTAWRLANEREKPDLERDAGFQERDEEHLRLAQERLEETLWVPADRALMGLALAELAELPADRRIAPVEAWIARQGGVEAALDRLFTDPALASTPARLALLDQDRATLEASDDPLVELARAIDEWMTGRRDVERSYQGATLRLQPLAMEARRQSSEGLTYPDANGTLRITAGHVRGYEPRDAVIYTSRTTARGVAEKAGPPPYDAPEELLAKVPSAPQSRWADPDLGDVAVNFVTTLDTTGGNSGSATINGKGELVGFVFDGNYESMSADWSFDPDLTRSVHVDIRYVLWLLDEVEGADWLIEELGVKGP